MKPFIRLINSNYTFIIVIIHLSCKTQKRWSKYNHEQCSDATFKISNLKIQSEEHHRPNQTALIPSISWAFVQEKNTKQWEFGPLK